MSIVLARHGETEWSANGRHTGRTDLTLTDAGRREAEAVGEALRRLLTDRSPVDLTTRSPDDLTVRSPEGPTPALVLISPRTRARDTAVLAGLSGEIDPDLAEWDYGAYEGRRSAEIRAEVPDWSIWTHGAPGGETVGEVEARADRVIDRVAGAAADGDVVLVSHGHFLRMVATRWIGEPGRFGQCLLFGTASLSVLGFDRGIRAIERWNDRHHLTG